MVLVVTRRTGVCGRVGSNFSVVRAQCGTCAACIVATIAAMLVAFLCCIGALAAMYAFAFTVVVFHHLCGAASVVYGVFTVTKWLQHTESARFERLQGAEEPHLALKEAQLERDAELDARLQRAEAARIERLQRAEAARIERLQRAEELHLARKEAQLERDAERIELLNRREAARIARLQRADAARIERRQRADAARIERRQRASSGGSTRKPLRKRTVTAYREKATAYKFATPRADKEAAAAIRAGDASRAACLAANFHAHARTHGEARVFRKGDVVSYNKGGERSREARIERVDDEANEEPYYTIAFLHQRSGRPGEKQTVGTYLSLVPASARGHSHNGREQRTRSR